MPRPYPSEFRARAVALVRAGKPISHVAAEPGIGEGGLHYWVRQEQIELLNRKKWANKTDLANAILEHIDIFHNRRRRHSGLDYRTPIEHEPHSKTPQQPT